MAEETDFSAHPHAGEGGDITNPVVVQPAIYMVTLPEWDDRTAMCTARYRVCYRWTDPRLAGWPEDKDVPADLWVPELALWGTISDATTEMLEQKKHAAFGSISFDGGSASSRAEGRLFFAFHFVTETLECKASTDIESFPLDSHCVDITISIGKTIAGCATKVAFDPSSVDSALTSGVSTGMDNVPQDDDEWIVDRVIWGYTEHGSAASGLQYHDLMLRFERRRDAGWYIRKAVWPTLLCALLSVAALVVPTTELGDRFSILLTLFLTAYAIQWVSTDRLPKTPKLTRLDKIVEGSVIFIIVIALWSMGMAAAVAHGGLFARGNRNSLEEGEGDGEGAATLRQIERVAFVVFSLVWLVGSVGQLLAIRKHSNRDKAPVPARWHKYLQANDSGVHFMNSWEGCMYEANVDALTGEIGTPRAIPGTTKPPTIASSSSKNPLNS